MAGEPVAAPAPDERHAPWIVRVLVPSVAGLLALAAVAWVAWAWWQSRLPDSYNVMAFGSVDYGGGSVVGHGSHQASTAGGTSVSDLRGPRRGTPDFRTTLVASKSTVRLQSGRRVEVWAFNGRVPGPEIRVRRGDLVEVTLVNRDIEDGVTLHSHGVDVPNAEDGVAGVTQDTVLPGGRRTYRFRVDQVGTFWYHSHQVSSEQVRRGLFGAFVIAPRRSAAPRTVDRTVLAHRFGGTDALGLVDDRGAQRLRAGTRVRLRLVNTDSFPRRFAVRGVPFRVLAIDGTEVRAPTLLRRTILELGAGGRYDVGFTIPRGPAELGLLGSSVTIAYGAEGTPATASGEDPVFDPATYGAVAGTPFDAGSRFDREFRMTIGQKLGFLDGRPGRQWTINGKIYPDTPTFMVQSGELIKVTIRNRTSVDHPMHLHGHHMLVLSRNGRPTTGSPWWVDTLNVEPDETYEVGFRADNPGLWMDHCHNLPHARDGLVMHVAYAGVTTPYLIGGRSENHPE